VLFPGEYTSTSLAISSSSSPPFVDSLRLLPSVYFIELVRSGVFSGSTGVLTRVAEEVDVEARVCEGVEQAIARQLATARNLTPSQLAAMYRWVSMQ